MDTVLSGHIGVGVDGNREVGGKRGLRRRLGGVLLACVRANVCSRIHTG